MTTAVDTPTMSEQDARRLTERIRITAVTFTEARTKLMELVQQAKEGNAHLALGYPSWTAYLAEVLGEEPMRLARDERQDMVRMLAAEGMSTRAIAPIVGASREQVRRDISTDTNVSDEPVAPRPVESMDGITRTYPAAPAPAPQHVADTRRPSLTDQAFNAVYDLGKALDRLSRITEDDRFPRNKNQIALKHQADLERHTETLTTILNNLTN